MKQFVITVERSAGNESVGEMWTETAVFPATATLADVESWVHGPRPVHHLGGNGRVTITYAETPMEAA